MKNVQYINPNGLNKNPAFSNVIILLRDMKTAYIGGQDSINAHGEIIGKDDIKKQSEQVLKNLKIALEAAGTKFENLIKLNLYIVHGNDPQPAFEASQKNDGQNKEFPYNNCCFCFFTC